MRLVSGTLEDRVHCVPTLEESHLLVLVLAVAGGSSSMAGARSARSHVGEREKGEGAVRDPGG